MDERLIRTISECVEALDDGLLVASECRGAADVEDLLQRGADPKFRNEKRQTPLMLAASRSAEDTDAARICWLLLEKGADVNAQDNRCNTALHMACAKGNEEVVNILLRNNPDLDLRNQNGSTAIAQPLMAGDHKVAKVLIAAGADMWTMNKTGKSLMHHLCAKGGERFIQLDQATQTELLIKDCFQDTPEIEPIVFHRIVPNLKYNLLKYILNSRNQNPLESILIVAVAMKRRADKSFMIRQRLEEFSDYFIGLANTCLEKALMKDRKLAMKVVGLKDWPMPPTPVETAKLFIQHDGNIFEQGPIMVALNHDLGEFFVNLVVQEAVRQVWKGALDNYELSKCSFLLVRQDSWDCPISFQLYRQVPFLFTVVELLFYLATLTLTMYIILTPWELTYFTQVELALICIMLGYACNEAIQMYSWGLGEYFHNAWTIIDLGVLAIFAGWFCLKLVDEHCADIGFRILTSNAFFMLFRLLQFVSMAEMFGTLVMAIMNMFQHILRFMLLYAVLLLSFTVIIYAQFSNLPCFQTWEMTVLQLFSVSVGSYFDFSVFNEEPNQYAGCTIVVIYMILASVMVLNLLIAVLCDAYYQISTDKVRAWCLFRAKFISERTMVSYFPPPLNMVDMLIFLFLKLFNNAPPCIKKSAQSIARCITLICDVIITIVVVLPLFSIVDSAILLLPFKYSYTFPDIIENYIMAPWLTCHERFGNLLAFIVCRPVFYYCFSLLKCAQKIPWIVEVERKSIYLDETINGSIQADGQEIAPEWEVLYPTIQEEVKKLNEGNQENAELQSNPNETNIDLFSPKKSEFSSRIPTLDETNIEYTNTSDFSSRISTLEQKVDEILVLLKAGSSPSAKEFD